MSERHELMREASAILGEAIQKAFKWPLPEQRNFELLHGLCGALKKLIDAELLLKEP